MKFIVFTLALIAATSAQAAPITFSGLCDTGVTTGCASQTPLASNTADGNFTVTMSPVGTLSLCRRHDFLQRRGDLLHKRGECLRHVERGLDHNQV